MISAIVPIRDWSLERLESCITRLRGYSAISEIILVDFGSKERLGKVPGCRVVRVEADRWCLSEANNIGIAEARNAIVLKIDADVQLLIQDETLNELAKDVTSGEVSFYVLQVTDFQYENGQPSRKRLRASWGEGGCNLFRRDDVLEIGGFDARYFDHGGEDNDLCKRLRRYGKRVEIYQSDAVLHERHPPSAARLRGQFTDTHKKALLADCSIFRPYPFRYSDYQRADVFGPAITVAIATTDRPNRAEHLAYCLGGLAKQTFQDFEVLICDNGTPKSKRLRQAALRKSFPTLDIHLHYLDEPSIPKARNLITDNARGFYIAVHDDDDFSLPTRFEEQLECMAAHDGAHGCHSSWIEFDEETGRLTSYVGQRREIENLYRKNGKVSLHGTALYRRDVLMRLRYDENLTLSSDFQLHIRMVLAGIKIPHTGSFHYLRRLHSASVSSLGPEIQRDVSALADVAYKHFVGDPFLAAVRAGKEDDLWAAGFPPMREMLSYLPDGFGAFYLDLDLEAALALGFDPILAGGVDGRRCLHGDLTFEPAFQGYTYHTRFVMRSTEPLTAGEVLEKLATFSELRGIDVVAAAELANPLPMQSIESLHVDQGKRRVISRRYHNMVEALDALPASLFELGLGGVRFYAVNDPAEGIHVLLGTFDDGADLEFALGVANSGTTGDYMAVVNKGRRGGYRGS